MPAWHPGAAFRSQAPCCTHGQVRGTGVLHDPGVPRSNPCPPWSATSVPTAQGKPCSQSTTSHPPGTPSCPPSTPHTCPRRCRQRGPAPRSRPATCAPQATRGTHSVIRQRKRRTHCTHTLSPGAPLAGTTCSRCQTPAQVWDLVLPGHVARRATNGKA